MKQTPKRGVVCRRCGAYRLHREDLRKHMIELHGDFTTRFVRINTVAGVHLYMLGRRL